MGILAASADERVRTIGFGEETMSVDLMDGRTITVPLVWYPRLLEASAEQRAKWEVSAAGYGIHWPLLDEDLSTEGLLRGIPAVRQRKKTQQNPVSEYDVKIDVKKRLTLRGSTYTHYHVREYGDGRIVLEPHELVKPFTVSRRTLKMMDSSMENLKKGRVGEPIDLPTDRKLK